MSAYLTIREYHPESGSLLGNISVLSFGRITAGCRSRVKVFDVAFNGVTEVGNIKIGIISSGGLTINANPTDISADGSASNGNFGIEYSTVFDSSKSSAPLSRHFAGLNSTITAADTNNVAIPGRSNTLTAYIYIDIAIDSSSSGAGNGAYKLFFDYA